MCSSFSTDALDILKKECEEQKPHFQGQWLEVYNLIVSTKNFCVSLLSSVGISECGSVTLFSVPSLLKFKAAAPSAYV